MTSEQVHLFQAEGRAGIKMEKELYDQITDVIINRIEEAEEATLADVLDATKQRVDQGNIEYLTLQVKVDLEYRGYLMTASSRVTPSRRALRMTDKGRRYFGVSDRRYSQDTLYYRSKKA